MWPLNLWVLGECPTCSRPTCPSCDCLCYFCWALHCLGCVASDSCPAKAQGLLAIEDVTEPLDEEAIATPYMSAVESSASETEWASGGEGGSASLGPVGSVLGPVGPAGSHGGGKGGGRITPLAA